MDSSASVALSNNNSLVRETTQLLIVLQSAVRIKPDLIQKTGSCKLSRSIRKKISQEQEIQIAFVIEIIWM